MKYKEFTNNSYGLEAKEVPPKPRTYADIKEDIREEYEVTDKTGKAYNFAKEYIDQYKTTYRPVPNIIKKSKDSLARITSFVLSGPDEKHLAVMLSNKSLGALKNVDVKMRKIR